MAASAAAVSATGHAEAHLLRLVPDRAMAESALLACNDAGAVDGISGEGGGSVDGMPLEAQLEVVEDLRAITLEALREIPPGGARP